MKKYINIESIKIVTVILSFTWANYSWAENSNLDEIYYTDLISQISSLLAIPILVYILFNKKFRMHFLWHRIIGKPIEIRDKKIRKELNNQLDLEHFRSTHAKIKVDNIYEVHAVIDFCKEEKIDVSELSNVPLRIEYDENKHPKVILPKTYGLIDKIFCCLLIIGISALFLLGAVAPPLSGLFGGYIFKMKETNDYIWLAEREYAIKLFTSNENKIKLTTANCQETNYSAYNMTENEFSTMCNVLKGNKEDNETLIKIKTRSIWLSSFICSITGYFIYVFSIQLIKINKTIKVLIKTALKGSANNEKLKNTQAVQ